MKRIFVTYGDDRYKESLERIVREAEATGMFDRVVAYGPQDLPEPFSSYIRRYERGGGYWLWKPYIIKKELDGADDGDIVVYADSGCTLKAHADWKRYFSAVDGREELFFIAAGKNRRWCRHAVMDFFDIRSSLWKRANQIQATFIIARKSGGNEVMARWCRLAENHHELFVDAADAVEDPLFREHRHDQAVLSACVCKASHPWRFCLMPEKLERKYAAGQAVLATRISNSGRRGGNRRKGRMSAMFDSVFVNPVKVMVNRLLYLLS